VDFWGTLIQTIAKYYTDWKKVKSKALSSLLELSIEAVIQKCRPF
jgi:hypothetical protein